MWAKPQRGEISPPTNILFIPLLRSLTGFSGPFPETRKQKSNSGSLFDGDAISAFQDFRSTRLVSQTSESRPFVISVFCFLLFPWPVAV
jgi:hypothetical protein